MRAQLAETSCAAQDWGPGVRLVPFPSLSLFPSPSPKIAMNISSPEIFQSEFMVAANPQFVLPA